MNNIEHLYNSHAVRIISNGIEGSGCIIQPNNSEYSYVFTAKHCLINSEDCINQDFQILRFNESKSSIEVKEVYLHNEFDIAIVKIGKIEDLSLTEFISLQKGQTVSVYGYPNILSGKKEQRQNVKCEISFNRETYFELTSNNVQFTFEKNTHENVRGFSGSGIYFELGNKLFICGILISLKASDGAYSSLCAANLKFYEELIVNKGLTLINSDNFSAINKDFKLINDVFSISFKPENAPYYQERIIDSHFNNYLKGPRNIWLSGISGVGKTLLVLRNLHKENINTKHIDLTCSQFISIDEYFEYINNELIRQFELENISETKNVLDRISNNLCSINNQLNEIIIFVDEVPISDKSKFYNFLTSFVKISEHYSNQIKTNNKIKWIVSTRINPEIHLNIEENCNPNKLKAGKNFIFKNFKTWDEEELRSLLELLQLTLGFSLSHKTQNEIIHTSKGLPGILKSTIERVIFEDCTIYEAIKIIKSENI